MSPTLSMLLLSWSWRPEIILSLGLFVALHLVGRRRLNRRSRRGAVGAWRTTSYLAGVAVLWVALMSPIDVLNGQLFFMHMVQHMLMITIAAPLIWLADPMPIAMWGLPARLRLEVGRLLRPEAIFRQVLRAVTAPGLSWLVFVCVLVGWHDPRAYNAALENELVHDLEHLTMFGSGMLFWWHVIGAAPHIHRRFSAGVRIGYVLSAVPPNMLTGIAISFTSYPIYTYYTRVPRLWGISVMRDQMLSGVLMWIVGSMMYLMAAFILIAGILRAADGNRSAT